MHLEIHSSTFWEQWAPGSAISLHTIRQQTLSGQFCTVPLPCPHMCLLAMCLFPMHAGVATSASPYREAVKNLSYAHRDTTTELVSLCLNSRWPYSPDVSNHKCCMFPFSMNSKWTVTLKRDVHPLFEVSHIKSSTEYSSFDYKLWGFLGTIDLYGLKEIYCLALGTTWTSSFIPDAFMESTWKLLVGHPIWKKIQSSLKMPKERK